MKRICVFIKDLRGGGAEKVAVNLARGLCDEGHEVDLVLLKSQRAFIASDSFRYKCG